MTSRRQIRRYLAIHTSDAPFAFFQTDRYRAAKTYDESEDEEDDDEGPGKGKAAEDDSDDTLSSVSSQSSLTEQFDSDDDGSLPPLAPDAPLDLGVRATRAFAVGEIIPKLLGKVMDLTDEQDDALRGLRLDFSVTMNAGRNKFQALFGPARFVNVRRAALSFAPDAMLMLPRIA